MSCPLRQVNIHRRTFFRTMQLRTVVSDCTSTYCVHWALNSERTQAILGVRWHCGAGQSSCGEWTVSGVKTRGASLLKATRRTYGAQSPDVASGNVVAKSITAHLTVLARIPGLSLQVRGARGLARDLSAVHLHPVSGVYR